jgi:hypothetical protein
MSVALVAIAKMEHNYIEEWVRYNLYIGFDAIYIYENDNEPKYAEMLKEFPQVKVIRYSGAGTPTRSIQYHMLQDFCRDYKDNHRWIAHFDLDEFLVLKKHKTIQEFCHQYLDNNEGGIAICWVHFGDNGHTSYSPEPVTVRFTKRENMETMKSTYIKCIVCSHCIKEYIDFHIPILKEGTIRTTSGTVVQVREIGDLSIDTVQLNHYLCKSWEEFQRKKQRGQAGVPSTHPNRFGKGPGGRYSREFFMRHNKNEVEDLLAKEIYEECLTKTKTPK